MGLLYLLIFCYIFDAWIQDIIEYSVENFEKLDLKKKNYKSIYKYSTMKKCQ
jgi:hypothetical protein